MTWKIIDSGRASAYELMAKDAKLLETLGQEGGALLHFYEWEKPTATYGYFVRPEEHLYLEVAEQQGLALARRPTGGGIVFHLWDMAFSVLIPAHSSLFSQNTLENYALINRAVLLAVKEFLGLNPILAQEEAKSQGAVPLRFCMAQPSKYDVMLEGRKVAGAAQRQTKAGFLHQGTIALFMPELEYLHKILLKGEEVAAAMLKHTFALLDGCPSSTQISEAKHALRSLLYKQLVIA